MKNFVKQKCFRNDVLPWIIIMVTMTTITAFSYSPSVKSPTAFSTLSSIPRRRKISTTTSTTLYGVLSRSQILRATTRTTKKNKPKRQQQRTQSNTENTLNDTSNGVASSSTATTSFSREFLEQVLIEIQLRQERILDALERELLKKNNNSDNDNDDETNRDNSKQFEKEQQRQPQQKNDSIETDTLQLTDQVEENNDYQIIRTKKNKQEQKEEKISQRRSEVHHVLITVDKLQQKLQEKDKHSQKKNHSSTSTGVPSSVINTVRQSIVDMGYESLLLDLSPTEGWILFQQNNQKEFGRPQGFEGLVFYSPLGVPILVSKPGRHNDEVLRRVSQQTAGDLWFQHEEYCGSRVLLRTSLKRGTKNSKQCIQMSANLAAYYSDDRRHSSFSSYGGCGGGVPIMYTDPKHVAAVISRKKGGGSHYSDRVGQMKRSKSLGRMMGYPEAVQDIASGKEP